MGELVFLKRVKDIFNSMGMKVLMSNEDYDCSKPDIIVIYEDMHKYYVAEAIIDSSFSYSLSTQPTIKPDDDNINYYLQILNQDRYLVSIAMRIMENLSSALANLIDKNIMLDYDLINMSCYAAITTDIQHLEPIKKVLQILDIDYQSLNIIDKFQFILISKEDTLKLQQNYRLREYQSINKRVHL